MTVDSKMLYESGKVRGPFALEPDGNVIVADVAPAGFVSFVAPGVE